MDVRILIVFVTAVFRAGTIDVQLYPRELQIEKGNIGKLLLRLSDAAEDESVIRFEYRSGSISFGTNASQQHIVEQIGNAKISAGDRIVTVNVTGKNLGKITITLSTESNVSGIDNLSSKKEFSDVSVIRSHTLVIIQEIIAWVYFIAWSSSFYPQTVLNFYRCSTEGFSTDFAILNLLGFTTYTLYNCFMMWSNLIQDQYFQVYEYADNPVMMQDVVFTVHATLLCLVNVVQCIVYWKSGISKISKLTWVFIGVAAFYAMILLPLPFFNVINWAEFLRLLSYVKTAVTAVKYVPQVYLNWKRKSTVGFSIWNIILDFTGGTLSMIEVIIHIYNHADMTIITGNPTKWCLAFLSIFFDSIFFVQNFCLYRNS